MRFSFGKLVVALLVILFTVDFFMRFLPADHYAFRAWEAMTLYHGKPGIFAPNRTYFNPHSSGDLAHIGNFPDLRQFRPERFTTDGCGNRNSRISSMVDRRTSCFWGLRLWSVRESTTDYTLSGQLQRLSGLKAYNAGGPTSISPDGFAYSRRN